MSSYEIRVPEALMLAPIQPWVKMVWIAVRSYQGAGDSCFASLRMIGERVVTDSGQPMDKGQVSRGVSVLEEHGFITRIDARNLRCTTPENVDPQSTIGTPANVDSQSTTVDPQSTTVDPQSTPSENQQLKPTRKTKRESTYRTDPKFGEGDWQHEYALGAYRHLENLKLLPAALAKERARLRALEAWADTFDKLHRLDGHNQQTIRDVMAWLFRPDNFWTSNGNFQSVTKLRKPHEKGGGTYFDTFLAQSRSNGKRPKQSNHHAYTADDAESVYRAALAGALAAGT